MLSRLAVFAHRDSADPNMVVCRAYKGWWMGPGKGAQRRLIGEIWMDATGLQETEALAGVLTDMAAQLRDGLA